MAKPAFDPSGEIVSLDKPAFDETRAFSPVEDGPVAAGAKPAFDPKAPVEAVAPSETPVPSGQEGGGTEGERPLKGKIPVPQPRPLRADVAETQPMPNVIPMDDQPFRAKMKGKVAADGSTWSIPGTSPETKDAPGLSGMLTGNEAYERQYGRPARDASVDAQGRPIPAQEAVPGAIDAAKAGVDEAQTRYDAAVARAGEINGALGQRGTTGALRRQNIQDEVDRAAANLDTAKSALGTTQRAGIETEGSARVFGAKAAEAVGTLVPTTVAGLVRPIDAGLNAVGLKRGTGVADYLSNATKEIANANLTDPQQQDSLSAKYGSGVGSMAGFIATGAIGKAMGIPQWAASAGAGGAQNAETFYQEANAAGATGMKKALSYIAGGAIGATEGLGSGRVLDQLDHVTGGGVKRYLGALVKSGTEEGFQEGLQQLLENIAKYGILGKDPGDITAEVGGNALIGAVLGMGMAGGAHLPTLVTGRGGSVEGGIPVPNTAVITPESIEEQVRAGNVPGVVAPTNDPTVPPPSGPTAPPPPGAATITNVGDQTVVVPTDPNAAPGTVPPTPVDTGEQGVETTVAVTPGQGVAKELEKIVTAAVQHEGQVFTGPVHSDAIESAAQRLGIDPDLIMSDESKWDLGGFVTNYGRYVTREEAQRIAEANDQIDTTHPGYLPGQRLAAETVKTEEDPGFYERAHRRLVENGKVDSSAKETPALPGEMVPVEGAYSRLRAWVEERGPVRATAQRWASILRRGDFTAEEARDMRVSQFLAGAGREQLTREALLNHFDQNAITLHEVVRRPMSDTLRFRLEQEIQGRLGDLMRTDPAAMVNGRLDRNYQPVKELDAALMRLRDTSNWTKYEQYTTPGPRQAYVELTMATPNRVSPLTQPEYVSPHGAVVYDPEGDSKYPWRVDFAGMEYNRTTSKDVAQSELQEAREKHQLRNDRPVKEMVGGHYQVPGEVVTIRATIRETVDGHRLAVLEEVQGDIQQKGAKVGFGQGVPGGQGTVVPDLPMKDAWAELGFSRFVQWAVDQGIRHIAWADADEHVRRYPAHDKTEAHVRRLGMQSFYNKRILSAARKWKGRVGATMGYETIPGNVYDVRQGPNGDWQLFDTSKPNQWVKSSADQAAMRSEADSLNQPTRFRSMIIPQTGVNYIKAGFPTYAKDLMPAEGTVDLKVEPGVSPMTVAAMEPLAQALQSLIRQLGIKLPINVRMLPGYINIHGTIQSGPNAGRLTRTRNYSALGMMTDWTKTNIPGQPSGYEIQINVDKHPNAQSLWVTMVHELGHVIERTTYAQAPRSVREAVDAAYEKYVTEAIAKGTRTTTGDIARLRQNAIDISEGTITTTDPTLLLDLSPARQTYELSKTEWFAEQVAKWATSSEKPLSAVEKFFFGLGRKILTMFNEAMRKFNLPTNGVTELHNWLDTQMPGHAAFFAAVQAETANEGTVANATQMGPEETPAPAQVETQAGVDGANGIFNGNPPPEVREAKAYADKFNWLYKWFMGIHQVAQRNAHIASLAEYTETLSVASMIKQQIMIRAQEVLKQWNRLGERQADAVSSMLDEVQNMAYRTADEIKRKIARHPTLAELQEIAARHGVSTAGFAAFVEIGKTFQEHLLRVEAMLRAEANKITDETKRGLSNAAIDRQMAALRAKPYFPAMRFGNYTITVRNAAGKVIHFETMERKKDRDRAADVIRGRLENGQTLQNGFLDKAVRPLLGVPTQLLELMGDKLKLSDLQRDALEQLKFELSPAQSFQHRFQHKKRIQGYSQDFRRAFASYFFHGANHIVKAQFADRLRELSKMTKAEVANEPDITKREQIVAYMNDHLENWLDPKSDWAAIRSVAFLWALAYSPAAAMQNLTQTLMTSYPFLASQFGDIRAIAALSAAGRSFETFYRKGSYQHSTAFHQRAIWRGMEDGIIKETQAPELAGYADGDLLGKGFGGNQLQRGIVKFNELGAFMFEMAEQVNRRIIFRAALQLALDHPNVKYVQDMVKKHKLHYDQLRKEGWTESEAAAYVVARDATITTQFQYGREYAPRTMRGKGRSVLVFKTFIQSYVMFLANYPKAAVRSLLIMGFLGGFMGLPGSDDLKELLKALAWRLFEKDFDLDQEGRRLIIQMLGEDENGRQMAELIMHGIARKGYGIPTLMDMLGGTVGIDVPMPTFDRSASISAGTILPVELGKLFGPPTQESDAVIAAQAQKASGAVFGAGFNIYRALMNHKLDAEDSKRWEKAVPRALGSVMKAYRVGTEGKERTSTGSAIVKYDVRDTEQLAEVMGMAAGYTPYRQTLAWERTMAAQDATKLWDVRRQDLMRQFGNAALGKDPGEITKMREGIIKFNQSLPPEARGKAITNDALKESVEQKAKVRAYQEHDLSPKKGDIPIMREVQKLYPESKREIRRVKPGVTP